MPDICLLPFFQSVKTASKNMLNKHGDIKLAIKCIDVALLDMGRWIGKGNWENGYGTVFTGFRDCMQRYYLRTTGQAVRTAQVRTSAAPVRTLENSLRVYIKEARRADRSIPPILRPLDKKMQNINDYDMIDVNDFMPDMTGMQRHRFILQLQQGLSVSIFLYTWAWGGAGQASTHTLFGVFLLNQRRMSETRAWSSLK